MKALSTSIFILTITASNVFAGNCAKHNKANLEAMACEVPVVSSNAGGLSEVNIHGKTGFLSDVGDVEDMAKNILHILQDSELHQSFREKPAQLIGAGVNGAGRSLQCRLARCGDG